MCPQDDVLIGTLTVRETLTFAANIRVPGLTVAERRRLVDGILEDLGLTTAADTYVGNWHLRGLSGGQKRRLSIGVELITSPRLIFLD